MSRPSLRTLWPLLAVLVLAARLGTGAWAQATARPDTEGARAVVVLENEFWKLTIWPDLGARVMHAIYKPSGNDWVFQDAGLFCDHVTQQTWPGELMKAKYDYEIVSAGPDAATVRVWATINGKGDPTISGVVFERVLTLKQGDPRLYAVVRLKNSTDEPRSPTPWIQNLLYVGGGKENNHYFRPSTTGVQEAWVDYTGTRTVRNGSDFVREPVAGWTALANTKNGEGAAFLMQYNDLFWLYNAIGALTVEWWYNPVPLPPGASWETPVTVVPFEGLKSVAYADSTFVAELAPSYQNGQLSAQLNLISDSGQPVNNVSGELTLLTCPGRQVLKTVPITLPTVAATAAGQSFDLGPLAKTQEAILSVKLTAGTYSATFEQFFDPMAVEKAQFGQVTSDYTIPAPKKVMNFNLPATATVTRHDQPHILLYEGLHTRFWSLDYAFRFLNPDSVKISHHTIFVYGDQLDYMLASPTDLLQYDLVILSDVPADALTDVGQAFLKLYVQHGGSLLILGGMESYGAGAYGDGDLASILPVKVGGAFDRVELKGGAPLVPTGDLGTSLFALPAGVQASRAYWLHEIAAVLPGAQVLMTAGGKPAIVTAQIGSGRVAAVLLTPYGVPPPGQTGFWQDTHWPRHLANLMNWLQNKEPAK
jgi:uncharacterized membrane protein